MILEILIWIPGAGKSTYTKDKENEGFIVVSSDKIRKELYWTYRDQSNPEKVFGVLFSKVNELLSNNKNVIIDATSKSVKDRKEAIKIWKRYNAYIIGVFFDIMPQVANERDILRASYEKDVGEEVIRRSYYRLEIPTYNEWFSEILILKDYESENLVVNKQVHMIYELISGNYNRNNFAYDFYSNLFEGQKSVWMSHDSEYHNEDVREHLENVVNQALIRNVSNNVIISTIFHDFGKYYSKYYNSWFERYTFEKHANVSIKLYNSFYREKLSSFSDMYDLDLDLIELVILNHNDYDRLYRKISKSDIWMDSLPSIVGEYLKKIQNEYKNIDIKIYASELYFQWICDKNWAIKSVKLQEDTDNYEYYLKNFLDKYCV